MIRPSTCDQVVSMWPVYLFAHSMAVILYSLVLHGDSIYLIKLWAPFLWFKIVRYRYEKCVVFFFRNFCFAQSFSK